MKLSWNRTEFDNQVVMCFCADSLVSLHIIDYLWFIEEPLIDYANLENTFNKLERR